MPRAITPANFAALQERALVARDFLWIEGKTLDGSSVVTDGTWSGHGNVSAAVINPDTGAPVTRDWYGSGTLVQISDIPLIANLTVQQVQAVASGINDHVQELIRGYDIRQGRVEIYRGLFDPESRLMVAPAECRFVGLVDNITINTPKEGEVGDATFTFVSQTQDLTRANSDTRSHASQRLRDPNDFFYRDAATTATWRLFWGSQKGQVPSQKKRKKFLGLF